MSIIHNLSEISSITVGSENIENIYLGEDLLWTAESSPYEPDQVIFEQSTAGTYSLDILADGQYEVYVIGGGAGGASLAYKYKQTVYFYGEVVASGGSGSGFIGIIRITQDTYTITVGAGGAKDTSTNPSSNPTGKAGGNSSIGSLITSYGASSHNVDTAGNGGNIPTISVEIISQTLNTKGNNGSKAVNSKAGTISVNGGTSVYNNYGAGGSATGTANYSSTSATAKNGTAGYVKIIYKGK